MSNGLSNIRQRFARAGRCLRRHIVTGELWYVGRIQGKVRWHRLKTPDLNLARERAAMMTYVNGNTRISIIDGDTERLLPHEPVTQRHETLPEIRIVQKSTLLPTPSATPVTSKANLSPATSQPTLREFIARWRAGKTGLAKGTTQKLDCHVKTVVRYLELDRPAADYRPQDIRDAIAKARNTGLKGQSINETVLRLLRNGFDLAVEEGVISENPVKRVKCEKIVPIQRKQLSWEDAQRVLDAVEARSAESALILRGMLFLGIGQAECKALTGSAVDWNSKKVHFVRRKTGQPYDVPIYPWTEQFLRNLEPRVQSGKPIFDWRNPRKVLETACRDCGFAPVEIRSLRRTLIVHLLEKGLEPRLIASWQGHADATLILKVYGKHINKSHEKEALAKLVE